jgi:dTDP-4-amino-4,6-dideoxygalactose transaminase
MEFYIHNINEDDIKKVVETLRSPFITTGKVTALFEKKLADYLKVKNTVALTSCTAALHLALLAYGVSEGDEVITSSMTFTATANAILHCGAVPVFADVEPGTGNINPDEIEKKITSKTKAIIPVHLYGVMCDMKKIKAIAEKNNLIVISDCAHNLEGTRDGYNSAEYCDAACYSFYATKNLASGEGGAVAVNEDEIADKIRVLRLHGMSKTAIDRYSGKYSHYDVIECGWKYNMDDIHASLIVNQLDRIDNYRIARNVLYKKYIDRLSGISGLSFPEIPDNCESAHHLFAVKVNPEIRDEIISKLQEQGVPVAVNFNPVHLMSYYKKTFGYKPGDFPETEIFGKSVITLPFYIKMTDADLDKVTETLKIVGLTDCRIDE